MFAFALRRLAQTIPTILAVVMVIFVLFSVIPGSIASSMGDDGRGAMDPLVMERMRKELGLDDPVYVRFGAYVGKLAKGDFGTSFRTHEPVTTMIAKRMWPTLKLVVRRHGAGHPHRRAAGILRSAEAGQSDRHAVDDRRRVGPVDAEILARAAADVPFCAEARLAAELWLWRRRAQIPDPARRDTRRLADGAAGADHARRRARDHERRLRAHGAVKRHERDAAS